MLGDNAIHIGIDVRSIEIGSNYDWQSRVSVDRQIMYWRCVVT